jgi:predicted Zn-dependent peptidase
MMRRTSLAFALPAALTLVAFTAGPMTAQAPAQDPRIPYTKYMLPNGLEVILVEDHSVPLVAVSVWYHVGAGDEVPGRSGFAHLFEHMMFQGTRNTGEDQHFAVLQDVGSSDVNGTTNFNRTNYYEVLPSNQLETALWLESERMGYLPATITEKSLANQREVVRNERRQSIDNVPYGKQQLAVSALLYPEGHPYRHLVIGTHEDLAAASVDDVKEFFAKWYVPANATLAIAGDVTIAQAKQLVNEWFGTFPKTTRPQRRTVPAPVIQGPQRQTVDDSLAKLRRIHYAWHTPPLFAPGDAELDVLASALGQQGTGRLYKILVLDKRWARNVAVFQESRALSSVFHVFADLQDEAPLAAVEKIVDQELEKVMREPITEAELRRAVVNYESQYTWGLESLLQRAETLQTYNHFRGTPDGITWDLDRYRKATLAGVQAIAAKHLPKSARVEVLTMPAAAPAAAGGASAPGAAAATSTGGTGAAPTVPGADGGTAAAASAPGGEESPEIGGTLGEIGFEGGAVVASRVQPAQAPAPGAAPDATKAGTPGSAPPPPVFPVEPFRAKQPAAAPPPALVPPGIEHFQLGDGIDVYLVERHQLPTISLDLALPGGSINDSADKAGRAALCMNLLDDGTTTLDKVAFEEAQADIAASVDAWAGLEQQGVSASTLTKHLARTLDLWTETLLRPGLRQTDHERNVLQQVASVRQSKGAPASIGRRLAGTVFYGDSHPFGQLVTEASTQAVTLDDCKQYASDYVRPRGAQLYVVGDVTRAQLEKELGPRLAEWKGEPKASVAVTAAEPLPGKLFFVDVPGAAQSYIALGHPGPVRQAPDYVPTNVMAGILGGEFSSRINMNLREDKGWAYGASAGMRYSKQLGSFRAVASVRADATKDSVLELYREVNEMAGTGAVTAQELAREKNGQALALPARFATGDDILATYRELIFYGLPLDYYSTYAQKVTAVTPEQVATAAKQHLTPERLQVIVVGDGATVLPALQEIVAAKALGDGALLVLDADGEPVAASAAAAAGSGRLR